MANARQSRPVYGLGLQVELRRTFNVVRFPLGSGIRSAALAVSRLLRWSQMADRFSC